jgi:hypothetical protein
MPTIDLTDEEHAAVTALIRRAVEQDRFPLAPRLEPLRSTLAKLDHLVVELIVLSERLPVGWLRSLALTQRQTRTPFTHRQATP